MKPPVASLLWKSLRLYQVFGANTNVGKTIFTTLLARTAKELWKKERVTYLKPVSTGAEDEADDRYRFAPGVFRFTFYQYDIPCSPHLAARASGRPVPSDDSLLANCREFAAYCAAQGKGWLFMETAGGVHSPCPSGKTQADLYIPLRVPSVLVGDSGLGGISQTISAFESLRIRGFDVESVLLFRDDAYKNYQYLSDYFQENHGIPVSSIAEPPRRHDDRQRDAEALENYYARKDLQETAKEILDMLCKKHMDRIYRLFSMASRASDHIWYPFTQQNLIDRKDIMTIDSAHGDYFQTLSVPGIDHSSPLLQPTFDASASWWTQGLGHSNPRLTLAAAYAAGRYGHVMFASTAHQPAISLAETLLEGMKNPRLSRVFYSDNGSTGVEVAVKMALRAARRRFGWDASEKVDILGLKGAYHGDTMGAMDCAEPGIYNEKIEWYQGRGYWLDYPTVICKDGKWNVTVADGLEDKFGPGRTYASLRDIFDLTAREALGEHKVYEEYVTATLQSLRDQNRKFGALMLEPVVLGAGGMQLVDPLFQRTLVRTVRQSEHLLDLKPDPIPVPISEDSTEWTGLPTIFDEVFTGLYRLGRFTPSTFLGVDPDISVHAKLLTGGLIPLCATLASENIFEKFLSLDKTDALLHGHSYTAHPIGCQVALESVREMQALEKRGAWDWAKSQGHWKQAQPQQEDDGDVDVWSVWPRHFVEDLSRTDRVMGAWALGSVLAIHMKDSKATGYNSNAAFGLRERLIAGRSAGTSESWNVHTRVLGNVLYIMASQVTSETSIRRLSQLLLESVSRA